MKVRKGMDVWVKTLSKKGRVQSVNYKQGTAKVTYFVAERQLEIGEFNIKNELMPYRPKKKTESKTTAPTGLDHTVSQVEEFHTAFGHPVAVTPEALEESRALNRTIWTAEELVEFLYATVGGDEDKFQESVTKLVHGILDAQMKILEKGQSVDNKLVGQSDAGIDAFYFLAGTFAEMGIKPQRLFEIVHGANMGKLFSDGKPRYRADGKILKPDNWEADFAPEPKLRKEVAEQIVQAMNG